MISVILITLTLNLQWPSLTVPLQLIESEDLTPVTNPLQNLPENPTTVRSQAGPLYSLLSTLSNFTQDSE